MESAWPPRLGSFAERIKSTRPGTPPVEAIFTDCERILGSGHPLTMISPENLRAARQSCALGEEGMAADHSVIITLDLNVSLPDLARDTAIRQPKPV